LSPTISPSSSKRGIKGVIYVQRGKLGSDIDVQGTNIIIRSLISWDIQFQKRFITKNSFITHKIVWNCIFDEIVYRCDMDI
jgi:hypothetical protein